MPSTGGRAQLRTPSRTSAWPSHWWGRTGSRALSAKPICPYPYTCKSTSFRVGCMRRFSRSHQRHGFEHAAYLRFNHFSQPVKTLALRVVCRDCNYQNSGYLVVLGLHLPANEATLVVSVDVLAIWGLTAVVLETALLLIVSAARAQYVLAVTALLQTIQPEIGAAWCPILAGGFRKQLYSGAVASSGA